MVYSFMRWMFKMTEKTISELLVNQISIPNKLISSYVQIGLDEQDVMLLLQIHRFLHMGIDFPTPSQISEQLTLSEEQCSTKLRDLFQRNFLEIIEYKNEQGQMSEAYSLEPLWQRLILKHSETENNEEGKLFILFENEFGRPLSPFEIDTINIWLDEDKLKPDLIISALRESVLMGKLNFKYFDRILREWQRKGVQSVEQAKQASQSFRKGQTVQTYQQEKRDTSVYFNWLDGGS